MNSTGTAPAPLNLTVVANFTAEPVEGPLRFWLDALQVPARVRHAPFDQVFQQLLDPASALRSQRDGIGLVLIRLQGWLEQGAIAAPDPDRLPGELVAAVKEAVGGAPMQLVICFCPATGADTDRGGEAARMEQAVAGALQNTSGVSVLTSASVLASYPCAQFADEHGQRMASIPYTPRFFSVLGTMLARSIYPLTFPAHKVLVLDCDDTLWGGLCSELGPQGVTLTDEHLDLQRFAIEQRRAGRLICLASRNNAADVLAVFDENPSMLLQRDDLTDWQINWGLKSDNLGELASRLGLGLDSFVFLDDDPVQCAEVRRRFPQVLALPVPRRRVAEFCRHIWPLDARASTAEGSRRTDAYREHVARENVRASSQSFQQFLDGLELQIDIAPLTESDLARATELTFRTNQFNLTGRRVNEAEFRTLLLQEDVSCFGVRVRDRFGDYGLVGLVLAEPAGDNLRVPVMLLSCRSLGRGVEYRMVAWLGRLARERGARQVVLDCVPTERNNPAREFLHKLGEVQTAPDGALRLALETSRAEAVQLKLDEAPTLAEGPGPADREVAGEGAAEAIRRLDFLATIPATLASAEAIHEAVQGRPDAVTETHAAADADPVAHLLSQSFARHLGLTEVPDGVGFFELGGHSLQAMQILSEVSGAFGVELDPTLLFTTGFTVDELATEINLMRDALGQNPLEPPFRRPVTPGR